MTRWVPGTDPLAPMPMTSAEKLSLVERVRAQTSPASVSAGIATRARWERFRVAAAGGTLERQRPTCLARVAARYAMLAHCSLLEAARTLRSMLPWATISAESISYHWERLYGAPAPGGRKRAGDVARVVPIIPVGASSGEPVLSLGELPVAYAAARAATLATARELGAAPGRCRYCGDRWTPLPGSKLDGHALCFVTPEFRTQLGDVWRTSPDLTRQELAKLLEVSVSTVVAWTKPRPVEQGPRWPERGQHAIGARAT